ncbi:MAG: gluconate 2-dehydrogenase subunit 3 family protein [Terriglobia bacterium]
MGQQGMERREMMRALALASVAAKFPGFRRWAFACDHEGEASERAKKTDPYQPLFFEPHEYATLERLTDLIIPNDGKPGALETGVAEFIDFMVASSADVGEFTYQPAGVHRAVGQSERIPDALKSRSENVQVHFRFGLNWMDGNAQFHHRHAFIDCTPEQQTDMLGHFAYKSRYRAGEDEGRAFFTLLRQYTVMGFYTTREGLDQLDWKGLQVMWTAMPSCPHQNDPEHLHLPPPVS